jgi:GT2 family glycosyltransferase
LDISFVIVSWNSANYLIKCIESILDSVCGLAFEVIVVDNGSTDSSVIAVRQRFPGVLVVEEKENLGFAKANNVGMKVAKGKYFCLANSDTVLGANSAGLLFRYMEEHLDVGLSGPMVLNGDGSFQPSCRKIPTLWDHAVESVGLHAIFKDSTTFGGQFFQWMPENTPSEVDILSGCFLVARREAVHAIGMFDERFYIYGEDLDWSMRFWSDGWKVVYYPLATVTHHGGASSKRQPLRFYVELYKAKLLFWDKYHGWLSRKLFVLILSWHHCLRLLSAFAMLSFFKDREGITYKIRRSRGVLQLLWGKASTGRPKEEL